jgi:nucleotide-binding universal stress UspA family protein
MQPEPAIVVGYVHLEDCDLALDRALEQSSEHPNTVIHVVRAIPSVETRDVSILDQAYEVARRETIEAVTRAYERMGTPATPLHIYVTFGDAAHALMEIARRVAAEIVIIGHGSDGAVARELARHLRCTLLVTTSDRYSSPDVAPLPEVAAPDDPNRKTHTYDSKDTLNEITYHIGPLRIF